MTRGTKIGLALGGAVFIAAAFGVGAIFAKAYTLNLFPAGFTIGPVAVGGMTQAQALQAVTVRIDKITREGITVAVPGKGVHTLPLDTQNDELFVLSAKDSVDDAALKAANLDTLARLRGAVGLETPAHVPLAHSGAAHNVDVIATAITAWKVSDQGPQNARFEFDASSHAVHVVPGSAGQSINAADLTNAISDALLEGKNSVTAKITETEPLVTTAAAENLIDTANNFISNLKNLNLQIAGKPVAITPVAIIPAVQPITVQGNVMVGIDGDILKNTLHAALSGFEQSGKNARFVYADKKVTQFQPEIMGRVIDWAGTAGNIFNAAQAGSDSADVAVKETAPAITLDSLNTLGIKEEIGFGTSDYSGSTPARLVNIKTGMAKVEGTLVAPGDTFSLIKALLPIDATGGYVQELVIKDDKTQPEFGGGLCQIGTTTFRAAMGAGLPVVERHNHSYQVHYYFENGVSGTDATIYDPKPDFRFTNDTGHWVMMHTEFLPKNILRFSIWGTKDGRTASRTIPITLATKDPPPKKLIETTTLPVGKKKCTELAHEGASTIFSYSVTYPNGTLKKVDFPSFYKPWGEVCLIGVAATSTPIVAPVVLSPDAAGVAGN